MVRFCGPVEHRKISEGVARSKLCIKDMILLEIKRVIASRSALIALFAAFSFPVICTGQEAVLAQAGSARPPADAAGVAADSLRCPLQEGITDFVVQLPKGADRFTFVNENAAVQGELKISVSNDKLVASDPRWTSVDGVILFRHKRLFNLSMVGVEANYVKLSFHVGKSDRIAALGR